MRTKSHLVRRRAPRPVFLCLSGQLSPHPTDTEYLGVGHSHPFFMTGNMGSNDEGTMIKDRP